MSTPFTSGSWIISKAFSIYAVRRHLGFDRGMLCRDPGLNHQMARGAVDSQYIPKASGIHAVIPRRQTEKPSSHVQEVPGPSNTSLTVSGLNSETQPLSVTRRIKKAKLNRMAG